MAKLKVTTFNGEWMSTFFVKDKAEFVQSFKPNPHSPIKPPRINNVDEVCQRIAGVIKKVKPKVLTIEEGPKLKEQMEKFVKDFLSDEFVVFTSKVLFTEQNVHILVHKTLASKAAQLPLDSEEMKPLTGMFPYYPWGEFTADKQKKHRFARVPLVLTLALKPSITLTLIAVHTKSKHSILDAKGWKNREREAVLDALNARQTLSAEVAQLREFIAPRLGEPDKPQPLIILGDFNDGPFRDEMEDQFLIHNIVDELRGSLLNPDGLLYHAFEANTLRDAWSVIFPDPFHEGEMTKELIDHILVSHGIHARGAKVKVVDNSGKVEHDAYDAFAEPDGETVRDHRPSDHRPVSVELEY